MNMYLKYEFSLRNPTALLRGRPPNLGVRGSAVERPNEVETGIERPRA